MLALPSLLLPFRFRPIHPSHRLPYRMALLMTVLATSACSTLPRSPASVPYMELPMRWEGMAVQSATRLSDWWLRFDDPLLGELVEQALRSNFRIDSAKAALRQARALGDGAVAAQYPTLQGSLSAQRNRVDAHGNPGFSANPGNSQSSSSFKAGLDAAWEVDVFGGLRDGVAENAALTAASAASLGDVQVSVAAEVVLDYINLRSAQERLAIAHNNLALQTDTLQMTEWRLQAGLVSGLEVEQSRAALEQTRALIPALQLSIAQTGHALAVLTGRTPQEMRSTWESAGGVPQPATDIALGFPAETLRQRADVRAAEYRIHAAQSRARQANAARWPRLQLNGSLGLNALTLAGLTDGATVLASVLANISVPLLDGGAGKARVRAQQAALEQAQLAYKSSVLLALQEVEDALVALRTDRQRWHSLHLAATAASTAAQLAEQRFQSGLVDFQTVLDTERTRLGTADSEAAAYASISVDHVRLYKALGGGWQSSNPAIGLAAP